VSVSPVLKGFLVGFLPTLGLVLFMGLLPQILHTIGVLGGLYTYSSLDMYVLQWFYLFQVIHVFLVAVLSSAFISKIGDIIASPLSIFKLLGEGVPAAGPVMMNYILMQGLGALPNLFLRPGAFAVSFMQLKLAKTEEARRLAEDPGFGHGYAYWLGGPLFVLLLGLAYAALSPIVLPCALLYFAIFRLCWRYLLIWVHRPRYLCWGRFLPYIYVRCLAGLVITQVTMACVMSLKFGKYQAPLLLPLPFLTYWYGMKTHRQLEKTHIVTPLDTLDGAAIRSRVTSAAAYLHPALDPEMDTKPYPGDPQFQEQEDDDDDLEKDHTDVPRSSLQALGGGALPPAKNTAVLDWRAGCAPRPPSGLEGSLPGSSLDACPLATQGPQGDSMVRSVDQCTVEMEQERGPQPPRTRRVPGATKVEKPL